MTSSSADAIATVVVVAYGVDRLDLEWVPPEAPIIVVHNDRSLDESAVGHPGVRHVHLSQNVGFGAAVNHALPLVKSERVILVNPDMTLSKEHWHDLVDTDPLECRTLHIDTTSRRPTTVLSPYPTPGRFVLMVWRVRHRLRRVHPGLAGSRRPAPAIERFAVADRWLSGALLSVPMHVLRTVGGFDDRFFLYYEDLDLFQRIAQVAPDVTVSAVDPAHGRPLHVVGGTAGASRVDVERIRLTSALTWAAKQPGLRWRAAGVLARLGRRLESTGATTP